MTFYDLGSKTSVDIPDAEVTRSIGKRRLKDGSEQDRYQVHATHEGHRLSKFVNKAVYDSIPDQETP